MRQGRPTEDGNACEAVGRDPDTLNGAASGETPGPRFFFVFAGCGEAPFRRRIRIAMKDFRLIWKVIHLGEMGCLSDQTSSRVEGPSSPGETFTFQQC
jgi:hypothetical protein